MNVHKIRYLRAIAILCSVISVIGSAAALILTHVVELCRDMSCYVESPKHEQCGRHTRDSLPQQMTDAFDWEGVLVLVDNDPEMALMMLQNFLESERGTFDKIVSEASKSADAVDWAALRKDSHSLKGSSSYLCLKQVTDLAYKMQRASEAKDKAQIDTLMEQLKVEFEIAFELLTNKLNELMSA